MVFEKRLGVITLEQTWYMLFGIFEFCAGNFWHLMYQKTYETCKQVLQKGIRKRLDNRIFEEFRLPQSVEVAKNFKFWRFQKSCFREKHLKSF